ncbi:MAG: ATP-binding protein [Leptospiraceae bacterium]|nr:ATP-binding protein [Leptospiraceae bacterium]
MKEIEVQSAINLDAEKKHLLDCHSFINILNVIAGELQLMDPGVNGAAGPLQPAVGLCLDLADSLRIDPAAAVKRISSNEVAEFIEKQLALFQNSNKGAAQAVDTQESIKNLQSALYILKCRALEYEERISNESRWLCENQRTFHEYFASFFAGIEQNSKGNYRIQTNIAKTIYGRDYLINMAASGPEEDPDRICLPAVFKDVLRDLIANARKYTAVGGSITAGIHNDGQNLRIVVEDTGRGIPEHELESVVQFGYRGSNVQDKPTMGGGFGLTKAWLNTQQLQGRMWIRSGLNEGTRIVISIPVPASEQSRSAAH